MLIPPCDRAAERAAHSHSVRVLIGNDFGEDVRTDRGWTGWWVQRVVWFATDGDIVVLPQSPDEDFVAYATSLTGTRADTLTFVVPPAGTDDAGTLTAGRLADPYVVKRLREVIGDRDVRHLSALWPDAAVADLARRLGVTTAMPGHGFVSQSGGALVNSKSAFRALAGGVGVPMPPGAVCTSAEVAQRTILDLLERGEAVVVKHDYLSGGRGNEILSTDTTVRPIGARRVVPVTGAAEVKAFLDERWAWLTAGGRSRPVVERYYRDSSAFFAEYTVTDSGPRLAGTGELLSAPYAVGQVMPAQGLEPDVLDRLVEGSGRLATALHAVGYRGTLSPDAIVTPRREVLFTEYNGRITGSTHIYGVIGDAVVGPGFGEDRIILERVWPEGWSTPSFAAARDRLTKAGLAYRPEARTGVVLTNAHDGRDGVMYCVVAEDLDRAWACDRALKPLFTQQE
ncbi:peptide ligase PGM1-related protein [Streptomyces sp. ME19-01-6]|uniref:preATP grasp domain-containing protein n=1 Tax=Streptomyces sp. ME19-01-6 TaxID=3028686 RepID=UPI0029A92647|nr:peptide ligase PGM1-related protein [Streptomyces sp. ME19-01-6]MDX3228657.1 peptide ligase PGM1-related protein [Streptomyces sp. ME19-01-6]